MPKSWYFVGNQRTGECCDVVAVSAETACSSRGWTTEDCVVIRVGEMSTPAQQRLSLHGPSHDPRFEKRPDKPIV